MNTRAYFLKIQEAVLAASHIIQSNLDFDEISESECYIRGSLILIGGFKLYVAEYVITEPETRRLKYRYHLQTRENEFVVRWDNAPHHPEVKTHPDHIHLAQGDVRPPGEMDIEQVLADVLPFLSQSE